MQTRVLQQSLSVSATVCGALLLGPGSVLMAMVILLPPFTLEIDGELETERKEFLF